MKKVAVYITLLLALATVFTGCSKKPAVETPTPSPIISMMPESSIIPEMETVTPEVTASPLVPSSKPK
ncbi:MAG: hypothetical protein RSD32_02575 [Oscillospiraceae bacterium]